MKVLGLLMFWLAFFIAVNAYGDAGNDALILFNALTGVPLQTADPRYAQMRDLIASGDRSKAAQIATADDRFYNVTLRQFASGLSNRAENPQTPLNDFIAMIIGHVADYAYGGVTATNGASDARELLTGSFTYSVKNVSPAPNVNDNRHYLAADTQAANLRQSLVRGPANQGIADEDTAGVLTSRGWGAAHLVAGTNRRATEFIVREFMCQPFVNVGDNTVPDDRIRRDVDRNPGGNPQTFVDKCSRCHRILDGLAGAFAFFEFSQADEKLSPTQGRIVYTPGTVARKMNQNAATYPQGAITFDNQWVNYATSNDNASLGWRGNTSGKGLKALGAMVASSSAFSACMAKRVYSQICLKKDFTPEGMPADDYAQLTKASAVITKLAAGFENGYSLRDLFDETAVQCLGGN